ncbi:MAG TPA: LysR family transcriptional regulator [Rhodoferax sp.]
MTNSQRGDTSLLDPKLLRLLDLLYTTRSVTRVAELLGQSQPTVSIWLGKLREQMGDPLFVRTPTGMQPTPQADALIDTAREVLEGLRRLSGVHQSFDPPHTQRRFTICMTDASHITLLPSLLTHVRALAPGVVLRAANIDGTLTQALQNGEADLALGFLPWLDAGFFQQTLYEQDWICLANARHPRVSDATPKHWNLDAYQSEAHIGIRSGTGQQLLEGALNDHNITRQIRLEMPGFLGLSAIVSNSDLIATLPRHIGETLARAAGLRTLPCPFDVPRFTVKQYWHSRFHHDADNRWLRGTCADLFMSQLTSQ